MKNALKNAALCGFLSLTLFANAEDKTVEKSPEVKKAIETTSFNFGYGVGKQLASEKGTVDAETFIKGIQAALAGKEQPNQQEFQAAMAAIQKYKKELEELEKKKNLAGLQAFLKEELVKTASGLEYKIIKEGKGEAPKATDTVEVHYTGYLTDGSKFDSSVDRGQPATFPLNGVIKGWTEGLQLMKPGAKYRFKIPAALGYGERGAPPRIPAGATLIFDVELLSIKK